MADLKNPPCLIAEVIVDQKIPLVLSYQVPAQLEPLAAIGCRCEVMLRNQKLKGMILDIHRSPPKGVLKSLLDISSHHQVPKALLDLASWMSRYYMTPMTRVIHNFIPKMMKEKPLHQKPTHGQFDPAQLIEFLKTHHSRKKKVLSVLFETKGILSLPRLRKEFGTPLFENLVAQHLIIPLYQPPSWENFEALPSVRKTLTFEQVQAANELKKGLQETPPRAHLLYGVCGSGKTEVYLEVIEEALKQKKGIIYLVPEIALAPQTLRRLQSRLGVQIALYHHQVSEGIKKKEWEALASGDIPIILGARSALFAPIKNLGLIIVDEEHEGAYKQEGMPTYHARDVALMRGKLEKAMVLLGSATPSLETYYLAENHKIKLHTLLKRPQGVELPTIHLVPLGTEFQKAQGFNLFTEPALKALETNLKRGEQSLIFINRRGYHAQQLCPSCAEAIKCQNCSIPMTFHKQESLLRCHFCGYHQKPLQQCPLCGHETLRFKGFGTQTVEARLQMLFKEARILRIDKDTTQKKGSLETHFQNFSSQGADILIGTQMIAKGLDFSHLTLALILNIDTHLNRPDFRAHEEAFQMMTQVAGRAGRAGLKGQVIIQTFNPDHSICLFAQAQDYFGFYKKQIQDRETFGYPPFSRLVRFLFSCPDKAIIDQYAAAFREKWIRLLPPDFTVEPIVPCFHEKIENHYRFQLLIQGKAPLKLYLILEQIDCELKIPSALKRLIDVDPLSTFF